MPRPPEFSEMLTERRRQLGYSVGQAAQALRLKEQVLQAFEDGDFASMPKSGYAQGMLASYARFLGLDPREVTRLFNRALEDYRASLGARGDGRARAYRRAGRAEGPRPASNQPEVPRRGLLPTSGGIAGDLGDYATTSSARPHGAQQRRQRVPYAAGAQRQGSRRGPANYDRYGSLGSARRPGRGDGGSHDLDDRHDDLARFDRGAQEMVRRARDDYGREGIRTRPAGQGYVDDLRYDDAVSPYTPASTRGGRGGSRAMPAAERPNVQRRPSDRQRRQMRSRGRQDDRRDLPSRLRERPVHLIALIVVAAALVITLILILSVRSCGSLGLRADDSRTVAVSQTTTQGTTNASSATSDSSGNASSSDKSEEEAAAERQIDEASQADDEDESQEETDVTVTVDDGAVTWLEIECDGESKVAETVTGPWTQTYVVTRSITVQTADTGAVSVSRNGEQVQFDSRASGIGTVTIQGTRVDAASGSASATTGTSSTVSTGSDDASGTGDEASSDAGDEGTAASSASSSSNASASASSTSRGRIGTGSQVDDDDE